MFQQLLHKILKVLSIKYQMSVSNSIKNKISFSCRSESSNCSLGQCQIRQGRFFLSCLAFSWFLGATWRGFLTLTDLSHGIWIYSCFDSMLFILPLSVFIFQRMSLEMVESFQMNFASLWKIGIFRTLWQNDQCFIFQRMSLEMVDSFQMKLCLNVKVCNFHNSVTKCSVSEMKLCLRFGISMLVSEVGSDNPHSQY